MNRALIHDLASGRFIAQRCEGHEDERADASGAQSRVCRRSRDGAKVAVTLQGADEGDTTTIEAAATAAAEQIEGAQAEVTAPQPLDEIIAS